MLVYSLRNILYVKHPFFAQFGLNKIKVGLMFLILPAVYVSLALVAGRLSDKLVSTQCTVAALVHVYQLLCHPLPCRGQESS